MRLLVTGATGLLGNAIVRAALAEGHAVRTLVRGAGPRPELAGLDVEAVPGELTDVESLGRAVAGVDGVIHSAALIHLGWSKSDESRRVNVEATRRLAELVRVAGVPLVHVSTVNTLGTAERPEAPLTEETPNDRVVPCNYVVSKREAEAKLLALGKEGLDVRIVLPGFMLGPYDWKPSSGRMLIETASAPPVAPPGGCSLCDARDVAAGALAALTRGQPGRSYILAGENLDYLALWTRFAAVTGGRAPKFRLGPVLPTLAGGWGDLVTRLGRPEPTINSAATRMAAQGHYFDSGRARAELGYTNRDTDTTIREAWDWIVAHHGDKLPARLRR